MPIGPRSFIVSTASGVFRVSFAANVCDSFVCHTRGKAMRWFFMLVVVALAGCQGAKAKTDYNEKPKQCDPRAVESGLCVPGEYEDSF